jgi:hypothetical protein
MAFHICAVLVTFVETNYYMKSFPVALFFFTPLLFVYCSKDAASPYPITHSISCENSSPSFSNAIFPIFEQNCTGCHSSTNPQGGYILDSHPLIADNIELIIQTIRHQPGVVAMPYQTDKLSDSLITIITCWSQDGSPNN